MAVAVETSLAARELLAVVLEIERRQGRVRTIRNGPRIIDIDILLYGSEVIAEPDLHIPHPRMLERRFVLEPLAEIAEPGLTHPITGRRIADHYADL